MTDWTNLQQALSPPRLGRYLAAFGDDERKACDGYIHNMRLSEALVSPISILEITLRNVFWSSESGHIFKPQQPVQYPSAFGSPRSSGVGSCCTPSRYIRSHLAVLLGGFHIAG